jgi:hypothetical protein
MNKRSLTALLLVAAVGFGTTAATPHPCGLLFYRGPGPKAARLPSGGGP